MTVPWYRRSDFLIASAVFVLALVVYCATMSDHISFWDCGEFTTASHILGIPHQPGTPLYVLVGRVFDIVAGSPDNGTPAFRTAWAINFMSAFFSALALSFLYLTVARLARRADPDSGWLADVGGVCGALFLLFSDTFWNSAIEAEVYGLAAFMITFLTYLALRWYEICEEKRSDRIYLLIVYLLALGVGFHLGSMLVYPGIFVLMWVARERRMPLVDLFGMSVGLGLFLLSTMVKSPNEFNSATGQNLLIGLLAAFALFLFVRVARGRKLVLWGSLLFLLGLSVHLFMLLRAPHDPGINQTAPDTFAKLMTVIRREQYPPINVFERQAPLGWQFGYYYDFFFKQFSFLSGEGWLVKATTFAGPIFLGLLGVFHGIRRARPVIWLLITNYLINGEGLTFYLNFTDHEVRDRDYFYFAAFLFFAMFIGLGVAALLRYAAGPEGKSALEIWKNRKVGHVPRVKAGWLLGVISAVMILVAAWPMVQPGHSKWFTHDRTGNRIAYEYAWNILAGLDEGAILFTNGDNDTFPIWYLQEVEHFRRDVTVVNLALINLKWYIRQLRDGEPPLPIDKTDAEIEKMRAYWKEDEETGEHRIVYVRDLVIADSIRKNARAARPRPVFFAVTIPRENMADFFPYLQMEGLAYRLRYEKSDSGQPVIDRQRLLDNMLGVYDFSGLMTGDNDRRREMYRMVDDWRMETKPLGLEGDPGTGGLPLDQVVAELGTMRTDIYMAENTVKLLGNYPAALSRAGLHYGMDFDDLDEEVSFEYRRYVEAAGACYDAAVAFDKWFPTVVDIYPMILVVQGRFEEAIDYVDSLAGRIEREREEAAFFDLGALFLREHREDRYFVWLEERVTAEPDRKIFYDVGFRLNQALHRPEECEAWMRRWEQVSGVSDPSMAAALLREQQRADEAVRRGAEEE